MSKTMMAADQRVPALILKVGQYPLHSGGLAAVRTLGRLGIPVHAIAGRDDRFFPVELQQRVARERLGVEPDVVPGGHLAALSRPADLAAALARYL